MTRVNGNNGNFPQFGLGIKKETGPELKMGFGASQPLTFLVKLDGSIIRNARVTFRMVGKNGKAKLIDPDGLVTDNEGFVSVTVSAGSEAADFSVIASSNGKDVGNVRVLVVANITAAEGKVEVSFASNVPGPVAHEIARLMKNDPRAALQLLAEHDPSVAMAMRRGLGKAVEVIAEPMELARSLITA